MTPARDEETVLPSVTGAHGCGVQAPGRPWARGRGRVSGSPAGNRADGESRLRAPSAERWPAGAGRPGCGGSCVGPRAGVHFRTFGCERRKRRASRGHGDTVNPVGTRGHWPFCCPTRSSLLTGPPVPPLRPRWASSPTLRPRHSWAFQRAGDTGRCGQVPPATVPLALGERGAPCPSGASGDRSTSLGLATSWPEAFPRPAGG